MKLHHRPHLFSLLLASLFLLPSVATWAASRTRHVSAPMAPPMAPGAPGAPGGGNRAERWSGPVGATVTLRVNMPEWTEGWLKSGVSWENVQAPQNTTEIAGRDIDEQSHHVLLMRTKEGIKGPHSWSPAALVMNDNWESKVYKEPWPKVDDLAGYQAGNNGPAAGGEDQEYRRFQSYVNWSE